MTEKKNCSVCGSFKNTPCSIKLAYILILISFIFNIFIIKKSCGDKNIARWIDKNPKAILDSVQKYAEAEQAKSQQQQQQQSAEALKKNKDRIYNVKNVGIVNKEGTKVIVEFFDYNCHYCQIASKVVDKLATEDKSIKVIFRELPIFGGMSDTAARYSTAVAIEYPERYLSFHSNLMKSGAKTENSIEQALKATNIPLFKIKKAMENKKSEIDEILSENRNLAIELGIQGTPAFIIGDNFIPGYIDEANIKALLK